MRVKLFTSAIFLLFFGHNGFCNPGFWDPLPEHQLVSRLLSEMTDEELLGQVLMFGYYGTTPSSEIMSFIEDRYIGGIKIFGWNVGILPELIHSISDMQKKAQETPHKIPLLIATDQEGGWVRHVKGETSITPGNLAIGATGLPYDAYKSGYYIGIELKALGINMNFAPTVDVYTNPNAHVIGPRAFSQNPIDTAVLAVSYFHGMDEAGVICTAKHFPGHGNADKDSHGALPLINNTYEELWNNDLVPYRFLIKEGIPAIMSGHLAFPRITGDETPSSLSPFFQTEVLRNRLGFDGILITDDLRMSGVTGTGLDAGTIAQKALESGVDIVMMSGSPAAQEEVYESLLRFMKNDTAFRDRVTEAAGRILDAKVEYLKQENSVPLFPDSETMRKQVPTPQGSDYFFQLACRSVTKIKEENLPLTSQSEKRILLTGQYRDFLEEGKKEFPEADHYYFPYSPFYFARDEDKRYFENNADKYDTIIFCLSNPNSLQILKTLEKSEAEIIVFSVLTPIYLRETPWVRSAIAVYGVGQESFQAGFAVLKGDYEAESRVPIDLTPGE